MGYPQFKNLLPHRADDGPHSFESPTAANSNARIIDIDQMATGETLFMDASGIS